MEHQDVLADLNRPAPLSAKLVSLHTVLKQRLDFIDRIAATLYDPQTDKLKTFLHSSGYEQPLVFYEATLSDATSLQQILHSGKPRVVNDLSIFESGQHEHTQKIRAAGYGSSYTAPMYVNGVFFGFLFFNSYQQHRFVPEVLFDLDVFSHLIAATIASELESLRTLLAALKSARDMTAFRDSETGGHLERMSRYSQVIARELAPRHGLTDEDVERIFKFAPLHDVGKIAIPDHVLLKAGKLTDEEFAIMKTHVVHGGKIIDGILADFGFEQLPHIEVLRNIALCHHESMDGKGYPLGLHATEIPLEARIISVADVFDALTSRRHYKPAWSNDEAFAMLRRLAGRQLDGECVEALAAHSNQLGAIQEQFQESRAD